MKQVLSENEIIQGFVDSEERIDKRNMAREPTEIEKIYLDFVREKSTEHLAWDILSAETKRLQEFSGNKAKAETMEKFMKWAMAEAVK